VPTLRQIRTAVCREFKITAEEIEGRSRKTRIAHARAIFCAMAKGITKASYTRIGREIRHRDHSTVTHLEKRGISLVRSDPEYLAKVLLIREALRPTL
jgi:chromosomal replication initiation ATPase DnaA